MELCDNCGKNPANEPDTCPYDEEFRETISEELNLCNCCDECRQECAWNI